MQTELASHRTVKTPCTETTKAAYEIEEQVGQNAITCSFKVKHEESGMRLQIHFLRKDIAKDPVNCKRFQQETNSTITLTHPNIVPVYDSGCTDKGIPFMVTELVNGRSLEAIIEQEGYIELSSALQLFQQVCDGLSFAHDRNILHRDLSTANIILSADDQFKSVKLANFGIARVLIGTKRQTDLQEAENETDEEAQRKTEELEVQSGTVQQSRSLKPRACNSDRTIGNAQQLPPDNRLDDKFDIFSLGSVMYQCLTGAPLTYQTEVQSRSKTESTQGRTPYSSAERPRKLVAPGELRPDFDIPPSLDKLILKCLQDDPTLRPASVKVVAQELQRIAGTIHEKKRKKCNRLPVSKQSLSNGIKSLNLSFRGAAIGFAIASIAYGAVCVRSAVDTPDVYIEKAAQAQRSGNQYDLATNWKTAVRLATERHYSAAEIALLNERAADELAKTTPDPVFDLRNSELPYWQPALAPGKTDDLNQTRASRAQLAQPFLEDALAATSDCNNRQRILAKLIGVSQHLNNGWDEATWLREWLRRPHSQDDASPMRRLATLEEREAMLDSANINQAGLSAAQRLLEEVVAFEPHPAYATEHQTNLQQFYSRHAKYKQQEQLLREMIRVTEAASMQDPDAYREQLNLLYIDMARCLDKQKRTAEADSFQNKCKKPNNEPG